jgi:hypothetical protein
MLHPPIEDFTKARTVHHRIAEPGRHLNIRTQQHSEPSSTRNLPAPVIRCCLAFHGSHRDQTTTITSSVTKTDTKKAESNQHHGTRVLVLIGNKGGAGDKIREHRC